MAVDPLRTLDSDNSFEHPLYRVLLSQPGLSVGVAALDDLLTWGTKNALWIFPMATSCCGIEFMAAAASRVDMDRMGVIVRATPRQADVMVVAGTITTKMAPRVLKLWEQMPEPKWCVAMGSCAISGDFYRNLYSVVPGIDTFLPVDVYVPGCPPNPEALMHGMLRLREKIERRRKGEEVAPDCNPDTIRITQPSVPRVRDAEYTDAHAAAHEHAAASTAGEATPRVVVVAAPEGVATPLQGEDFEALLSELGIPSETEHGPPLVPVERHFELARRLKELGYKQYVTTAATHWLAGTCRSGADEDEAEHFEVVTVLRTVGAASRTAAWAVRLAPGEVLPTLTPLFAGADWQEREQYDLVGVLFAEHPDLRRLMMTEDYEHHPLRRDFAADSSAEPWR